MKIIAFTGPGFECSVYMGEQAARMFCAKTFHIVLCAGDIPTRSIVALFVRNNTTGQREAGVYYCPSEDSPGEMMRFFQTDGSDAFFAAAQDAYWRMVRFLDYNPIPLISLCAKLEDDA